MFCHFLLVQKVTKKDTQEWIQPIPGAVPWFSLCTTVTSAFVILLLGSKFYLFNRKALKNENQLQTGNCELF